MVRVTNTMMHRKYMTNLNSSLVKLSESTGRISSGKQHSRLSQSPLDVSRAMRLEEDLSKNSQYVKVLDDAQNELASAESNLMSVVDVLTTAYEKTVKAANGTTSEEDRAIIAGQIDSYIEFTVKAMNATFNDKFLFSNTNNSDNAPFEVTDNGEVLFNGANVDHIYKGDDGNYYVKNYDEQGDYIEDGDTLVMESNTRYVDVGLGMSFDKDGNVIPSTALEVSFGGLDSLGFGLNEDGLPNNILSVLVGLKDAIHTEGEEFDLDTLGQFENHLIKTKDTTNFYIANIGTRSNYMEKSISRLENEEYNLESLKSKLVEVDTADEIIAYKQYEFSWNAILQMGSKLIPTSLMDYVK